MPTSTVETSPASATASPSAADDFPRVRTWTREEFYRMAELGFFRGERAERIEGEIVVQSPQKWAHASTTDRVADVLRAAFAEGHWVRMQLPLAISPSSDPEPDVSVVVGRRDDYRDHPTAAVLLVEVAESSLLDDRGRKTRLYATAGVPDYWVVNLIDRQLEVYRDPQPDPSAPDRRRYTSIAYLSDGQTVAPIALSETTLSVADILGRSPLADER